MFLSFQAAESGASLILDYIEDVCQGGERAHLVESMLVLAGMGVEVALLFDNHDDVFAAIQDKLAVRMGETPFDGDLNPALYISSIQIDEETERGRTLMREYLEETELGNYELLDQFIALSASVIASWGQEGYPTDALLKLMYDYSYKAFAYEIAAQELCDYVIDNGVGKHHWSLPDCFSGLSAMAGRRLAMSESNGTCQLFEGPLLPYTLDSLSYVMTREAVQLGVQAGTDWRFGLAANDTPVNAPVELTEALEPVCQHFFSAIELLELEDQAVACAKAAGRMIAVAAGGEMPEIEPSIAKPLAMMALTESYKHVCSDALAAAV